MVHLIARLVLDGFVELVVAPVVAHLGVHHILADGGESSADQFVEYCDNLVVAFHFDLLCGQCGHIGYACWRIPDRLRFLEGKIFSLPTR